MGWVGKVLVYCCGSLLGKKKLAFSWCAAWPLLPAGLQTLSSCVCLLLLVPSSCPSSSLTRLLARLKSLSFCCILFVLVLYCPPVVLFLVLLLVFSLTPAWQRLPAVSKPCPPVVLLLRPLSFPSLVLFFSSCCPLLPFLSVCCPLLVLLLVCSLWPLLPAGLQTSSSCCPPSCHPVVLILSSYPPIVLFFSFAGVQLGRASEPYVRLLSSSCASSRLARLLARLDSFLFVLSLPSPCPRLVLLLSSSLSSFGCS